ncbi:hypothetical protein ACU4GR_08685 (plasmid) [Methylobacterium oryzae CBMB20]
MRVSPIRPTANAVAVIAQSSDQNAAAVATIVPETAPTASDAKG